MDFSRSQGQIGFLPTLDADASLGSPSVWYQGAPVAMDSCDEGEFALSRVLGTAFREHAATKDIIAQRAKVCYCAGHTRPTHVTKPPVYALGVYGVLKSRRSPGALGAAAIGCLQRRTHLWTIIEILGLGCAVPAYVGA